MSKTLIFGIAILVGIVINFSVLYAMTMRLSSEVTELQSMVKNLPNASIESKDPIATESSETPIAIVPANDGCPGCRTDIDAIKKIVSQITPAGRSFNTLPSTSNTQAKEFFVSLGNGKTGTLDWEDVPGMSATIDSTNYTKIKSVIFEVSLRIPTANGTVSARLFNKTDQHPVWFSEVSSEGALSVVKQAANIGLDSGAKLYQVQMKSSLQFEAIADSARMKIVLQ